MRSTERFSDKVENYVRYRPGYPDLLIEFLKNEIGLGPSQTIADIGSGTGKLTELLLQAGFKVIGVEPNDSMREACEQLIGDNSNFESIDGTAENSTLNENAVDAIIAAQSFHWFDIYQCLQEFKRILKKESCPVLLIWNERELKVGGIMKDYNQLITDYSIDYRAVNHHDLDARTFDVFFQNGYKVASFECLQPLNREGFQGRYLSCSYALPNEDERYSLAMEEIERIYENYEENEQIILEYSTTVYYGCI